MHQEAATHTLTTENSQPLVRALKVRCTLPYHTNKLYRRALHLQLVSILATMVSKARACTNSRRIRLRERCKPKVP